MRMRTPLSREHATRKKQAKSEKRGVIIVVNYNAGCNIILVIGPVTQLERDRLKAAVSKRPASSTVGRLVKNGGLPTFKVINDWRFDCVQIEDR
jgi:hypothetical protein